VAPAGSTGRPTLRRAAPAATLIGLLLAAPALAASAGPPPPGSAAPPSTVSATTTATTPAPTPAAIAHLQARFAADTRRADAAYARVSAVLAKEGVLREDLDNATTALQNAQAQLDGQLARIYEQGPPSGWNLLLGGADTADLATASVTQARSTDVDEAVLRRVAASRAALAALEARTAGYRRAILAAASTVFAAQDDARTVLDTEMTIYADDQSALAALHAEQAVLDAQASGTALATEPGISAADRAAAADQAPVLQLLEETPSGSLPAGYHATGQTITGVASWYGPGFVGSPTASGAPYNPEAFSAAMLSLPLGTVVHVTGPDGTTVNVLVNDRGPYVHGRVIDLSEAAAAAIGVGLDEVTIEVLAPGPG
jgi:rare lipoprotein A